MTSLTETWALADRLGFARVAVLTVIEEEFNEVAAVL
jgi:hypothetical protein